METIQGITNFNTDEKTVITIGTFDGVHIGHHKILERLINSAKKTGLKSTLLTFSPHPRMVLQKDTDLKLLNTINEKALILNKMGLDYLIIHPFTKDFSRLSANEFVRDILVNTLNIKKIILGHDHRFGRNRNANIDDLIVFGNTLGFEVEQIPAQEIDEVSVSSTKIRRALLEGDIETANSYLGYHYMLSGSVVKGKGLGRTINFPTANLELEESHKLIPKKGVYAIKGFFEGTELRGMMNIGTNPTVAGTKNTIEVHLFNFDKDLYGKNLRITILHRIRDEKKFDSLELLQEQLKKDKETVVRLLSK